MHTFLCIVYTYYWWPSDSNIKRKRGKRLLSVYHATKPFIATILTTAELPLAKATFLVSSRLFFLRAMVDSRPSRVSMSVQPTLHLLSYELQLASVSKDALPEVTHSLLQLTLRLLGKDSTCRR